MFCKNCGQQINDQAEICPYCKTPTNVHIIFCTHCGKHIDKSALKCPYCGTPNKEAPTPSVYNYNNYDTAGFGWNLLGFLISPILSLILYLCFKDKYPAKMSRLGKGAIAGVIVSVILIIIGVIVAISNADDYYQVFDKFTAMISR